jgi:hypothetical protein
MSEKETKKKTLSFNKKPKFSPTILAIVVIIAVVAGGFFLYRSYALDIYVEQTDADELANEDPEPVLIPEISEGVSATLDPAADEPSVQTSSSTAWKTTTSEDVYNNGKYWKTASMTARSSCELKQFTATTRKALYVGMHHVEFKSLADNNDHVNYYVLNPRYVINGQTNYETKEEHLPGFGTKKNIKDYRFLDDTKSNDKGYTGYSARLTGFYLYKKAYPNHETGIMTYYLYRVTCGAKNISPITSPKPVNGVKLRDKAVTRIGDKETCTNNGYNITKYLDAGTGSSHSGCPTSGYPWCAAFVTWVWKNTALGMANKPTFQETAASGVFARLKETAFVKYTQVKSVSCDKNYFARGDILIRNPGTSTGHVGMVRSYWVGSDGVKHLRTIEGNSSDAVSARSYDGAAICSNWSYYGHWRKQ